MSDELIHVTDSPQIEVQFAPCSHSAVKRSAMKILAFEAQGLIVLVVLCLFILINFGQCRFRQAFSTVFVLKLVPWVGKIFLLMLSPTP